MADADGLAEIVRRRRWVLGWLLAGLPIVYSAGKLLGEQGVVAGMIIWVTVFFGLIVRHLLARCPRCDEYFNWSQRHRHQFAENCMHCGLDLQASPMTGEPAYVGDRLKPVRRTGQGSSLLVTALLWLAILGIAYVAWAWIGTK